MPQHQDPQGEFDRAVKHWERVDWPFDAYAPHRRTRRGEHTNDLYLAGAAGHRLDTAWEVLDEKVAPRVKAILRGLAKADYDVDELWLVVMSYQGGDAPKLPPIPTGPHQGRPQTRIANYFGGQPLAKYLAQLGKLRAIDRHRHEQRRPKQSLDQASDSRRRPPTQADLQAASPTDRAHENELLERIRPRVQAVWDGWTPEERTAVCLIYGPRQMEQMDVALILKWAGHPSTISRKLARLRDQMQATFEGIGDPEEMSPQFMHDWADLWFEKCPDKDSAPAPQPAAGGPSNPPEGQGSAPGPTTSGDPPA